MHIKPIHKAGDKKLITNYRPISLTNNLGKVLEKLIKKRLMSFLENRDILSKNQFGFRQGRGTHDALFELGKIIHNVIDENQKCIAVFLDLAKCFDTVSHAILFKKLEATGVRGITLEWFKSYLSGRQQCTVVGDGISDSTTIRYGIPQGTVLGPVLYLVYANELCNKNLNGKIISFADDTVLLFEGNTWDNVLNLASNELQRVQEWFDRNLLTLNIDKTKFLAFSAKQTELPRNIFLKLHSCQNREQCNCPTVVQESSVRYLGVLVDDKLKWDLHCVEVAKKIRKVAYKFILLRNVMNDTLLKSIYFSLVQSVLSYGIIAWGAASKTSIDPVYKAQKLIIKIINKKPRRYSTDALFREYDVMSVRKLYIHKTLLHLHYHSHLALPIIHQHNTRIRHTHYQLPRKNKTFGQKHASYIAPKLYNKLPIEIKQAEPSSRFRKLLKDWILNLELGEAEEII